jgi:hypothetical protein
MEIGLLNVKSAFGIGVKTAEVAGNGHWAIL